MKDYSKELSAFVKPKTKILNLLLNNKKIDFNVYRLPRVPNAQFFKKIIINSLILVYHPQVRRDLESVREHLDLKVIPIKTVYVKGNKHIWGSFSGYAGRIKKSGLVSDTQLNKTIRFAGGLAQRCRLNKNTYMRSLEIYLLTDVFPVPIDRSGIHLIPSRSVADRHEIPDEVKDPNILDYIKLDTAFSEYGYSPVIRLDGILNSPNELIEWVKNNWPDIKKDMDKKKEINRFEDLDIDRFACGLWLWDLKNNKKWSWDKIDDKITEITDKDEGFWGMDEKKFPPDRTKGAEYVTNAKSYMKTFLASEILE